MLWTVIEHVYSSEGLHGAGKEACQPHDVQRGAKADGK
jgi:hypothetical protein